MKDTDKYDGYGEGFLNEFDNNENPLMVVNKYSNTVIVPMRSGSKGIKDKNIKDFGGLPLYYWTIKKLHSLTLMGKINKIIVSSDNDWYLDRVKLSFGSFPNINLILSKRPESLSMDSSTTDEVVLYELDKHIIDSGIVSIVEVTSPLIPVDALNLMFSSIDDFTDSSFLVYKDIGQFWKCKRPDYKWEPQYKQRYMRQMENDPLFREVGAWCTKVDKFRESGDRISGTVMPIVIDKEYGLSINDANDFRYAELLAKDLSPAIFKDSGLYR